MNGDTSRTMSQPIDADVLNSESCANGNCCENSNNTENDDYENEDSADLKSNYNDDVLEDYQDNDTDDTDDTHKATENSKKKNKSADSKNDGDPGEEDSQGVFDSKNDDTYDFENSLDDELVQGDAFSQDKETINSDNDNNSYVSDQDTSVNVLTLNHNSDESSGEDTVGDTISSGVTEREQQQNVTDTLHKATSKIGTFNIIDIRRHHSDDEMESIISSDDSDSEGESNAEDALSINSDSDDPATGEDSQNVVDVKKDSKLFILGPEGSDHYTGTLKTTEIQEIEKGSDNDDCVMTTVQKIPIRMISPEDVATIKEPIETNLELLCSSRTIKRKKYDDGMQALEDDSDIEEVSMEDPLKHKSKQIFIKNTMHNTAIPAEKPATPKNYQKLTTVVIIDSPTKSQIYPDKKFTSSKQNIYQRIAAHGTSVTPVVTKNMSTQATQSISSPPVTPLLPTLTDEMFVVEAPSFIVPYVYEKPAVISFKGFVDKLGKELEEEKAKEKKELLEKKKEAKAKREQETQKKSEKGDKVVDPEDEINSDEIKKKKVEKAVRKERRRRKKEEDDVSWDGTCSDDSEDDTISDDDSPAIDKADTISDDDSPAIDKAKCIEKIKEATDLTAGQARKPDSYFDLCLGKFFMDIGLNLATEYVQTDLLNQQNRQLSRELKAGHDTNRRQASIALLTKNLEKSQESNNAFIFEHKKCKFCPFKTESALAMANHMETPHMKNNQFKCNFCPFEIRSQQDILHHMDKEHGIRGKLERTLALHQCSNCPFEDHGKGKLARHLIACAKKFKPTTNCAPPIEWEHPAKITKPLRPRSSVTTYSTRYLGDNNMVTNVRIPIVNAMQPLASRSRGPNPMWRPPTPIPVLRAGGAQARQSPVVQPTYIIPGGKKAMSNSISITALPRQSGVTQPLHTANTKGFVMCEICDGYIKDLQQLRNHMQWIHRVKIHPKMIYNRPPLNCQKCQFRFFTDQGLERHLLGSHGLVTSSIQDAANRGEDSGRCPICGRVYQWKLLVHVSRDHNLFLKPAHLSYKCTVCTATFALYRQFENHVYSVHSVVAKKVIEKKSSSAKAIANANDNAAKQLKINNEITITPQPVKMPVSAKGK